MGIMDPGNSVGSATLELAALREKRGEWVRALRVWESWKQPRSWCGNGSAQYAQIRLCGIARCRMKLGDVDGAFEALAENEFTTFNGFDHETAFVWNDLATETGRWDQRDRLFGRLLAEAESPADPDLRVPKDVREEMRESARRQISETFRGLGEPARAWLSQRADDGSREARSLLDELARPEK